MRKRTRFVTKKGISTTSFFNKIGSVVKIIKIELLIALIALVLSLGQYFQNSITVRINITRTWKEGYNSEIRDRVARFRYFYKEWKDKKGEKTARNSLKKLIDTKQLFDSAITKKQLIDDDDLIKNLVSYEIKANKEKSNIEPTNNETNKNTGTTNNKVNGIKLTQEKNTDQEFTEELTKEKYVEIILKYRNAIIECLNTAEAVKAVIQSKPLPFRITIFYKDTLEGRYRDIIEELKTDLMDFIEVYRDTLPPRETEAWYVLTSEESDLNDLANIILYFLIFSSTLTIIYFAKTRMKKRGLLQENSKEAK